LFNEAYRIKRAAGHQELIAFCLGNLGRLAARSGRFDEASQLLAEARSLFAEVGNGPEVVNTDARIAECHVLQGHWEDALTAADETLQRAESAGVALYDCMLHRIRGYALAQAGRLDEARIDFEKSVGR